MLKKNDNKICEQIIEYYLFHKKIECIFNNGFNPFFEDIKNNILTKTINPYNEILEENLCIIDNNWIDYWKVYSNYEKAKSYFDKINIYDRNINILKELEEMSKNMIITNEINTEGLTPPPYMDNTFAGNEFCNKLFFNLEDFKCLVSFSNYISFCYLSGEFFEFKTNTRKIEALIIDKIIFLIFDKEFKVKIIYKIKNNIVQLTADFVINEFNEKENKKSSENRLFKFKREKIRRKRTDYWFYFFDSCNIENFPEVEIRDKKGQVEYILRNDKLFFNQKSNENYKICKMPNKNDNTNTGNINDINQINNINNNINMYNNTIFKDIDRINIKRNNTLNENNENRTFIFSNTMINYIMNDTNLNNNKFDINSAHKFKDNIYYNNKNIFKNNMGNMNKINNKDNNKNLVNNLNDCNNKVNFSKKNDLNIFKSNNLDLPTKEIIFNALNKNNIHNNNMNNN